jgi:hypothetical protein
LELFDNRESVWVGKAPAYACHCRTQPRSHGGYGIGISVDNQHLEASLHKRRSVTPSSRRTIDGTRSPKSDALHPFGEDGYVEDGHPHAGKEQEPCLEIKQGSGAFAKRG